MSDSGGYEQFRLLGRSPHLLTYRARAERLGGDMVLRIYPVELGAEEPSQLFIDQMRRLANLRGRGLVTPIEVGHTDAGAPYVTRRYVDAPSLENLVPVRSNDLDAWTGQISWFGSRLCHTVAALHEIGSVHGSIRPSNIFVTAVGTLHVTDVVPRSAMTLGVHGIQRRPDHLAPEVLAGDLPDRDSDVYAIASVLRGLVGNEVITNLPTNLRMIFDEALDSRPGRRPPLEEMAGCFDRELGERGYEPARQTALPSAPQRVAIESSNHEPVAIGLASNGASAPDTEAEAEAAMVFPETTGAGRSFLHLLRRLVTPRRRRSAESADPTEPTERAAPPESAAPTASPQPPAASESAEPAEPAEPAPH